MKFFKVSTIIVLLNFRLFAQSTEGVEWEWAIKPQFDEASCFFNGFAAIKMLNGFGFVNRTGVIVVQPQFEDVGGFTGKLSYFKLLGKFGYIDTTGVVHVKQIFDQISSFNHHLDKIELNGKYGLIDNNTGKIVLQAQYDEIEELSYSKKSFVEIKLNEKIGIIDTFGNILFNPQFDGCYIYEDNVALTYLDYSRAIINLNSKNIITQKEFETKNKGYLLTGFYSNGYTSVIKNFKWGYVDTNGKVVIEAQFDVGHQFYDGLAKVGMGSVSEGFKYGYINKTGNYIVKPQFDEAMDYNHGFAIVKLNGKYGVLNNKGEWLVKAIYEEIGIWNYPLIKIKLNGKWGLINATGKKIVKPKYDAFLHFGDKTITFKEGIFLGLMDLNGKEIHKSNYENIHSISDDLIFIQVAPNYKWAILDSNGNTIVPLQENAGSSSTEFSEGLIIYKENLNSGFINKKGKIIVAPQFHELGEMKEGLAFAKIKNGKFGFIKLKM